MRPLITAVATLLLLYLLPSNALAACLSTNECASKLNGYTVLDALGPDASKINGYAILDRLGPNASKINGYVVLCAPAGVGGCPAAPAVAGGLMLRGIGN